jgi:hypothetical protein
MERREDSFWYPTARLFRQTQWSDWAGVFARIAAAVREENFARRAPIAAGVSLGDLFDRLTRGEIDRSRVRDEPALDNICTELGSLRAASARCAKPASELQRLIARLRAANEELLRSDDEIRQRLKQPAPAEQCAALALQVLRTHDAHAALKRQVDAMLGA